ncbi:MAG: DUF1016 N-terminal domain-containing protein [Victivallales bacterium]|jgi:predicted nuclease of restriction endonuclease-like (RecB) superfamily|nr:DUF1016 N-terminal domain-containing protein [Victivallales bacterium]
MPINNREYLDLIAIIKQDIAASRQRAVVSVNKELLMLYWRTGKHINKHKTWGSKFTENLARDIRFAFPTLRGFSFRNLKYMSQFASIYTEDEIGQGLPAQLTWTHNQILMDNAKDKTKMLWYAGEALKNGWSSNVLAMQDIETRLKLPDDLDKGGKNE